MDHQEMPLNVLIEGFDEDSIRFISAGLFDGSVVQKSIRHSHNTYELLYHLAGQGNIMASDQLQTVKAYDAVLIPPGVFHTESSDTYLRKKLIWIRFNAHNDIPLHRAVRLTDVDGLLRHDVERLYDEVAGEAEPRIIQMRLHLILHQLKKLSSQPVVSDNPVSFLSTYLNDHYAEDISFSDIAKHMGISPSYLSSRRDDTFPTGGGLNVSNRSMPIWL